MKSRILLLLGLLALTVLPHTSWAQLHHFTVEAPGGGPIGTQTAGTQLFIQIVARDTFNATVAGFSGTVEVSSPGDLIAGSGTTASFTGGVLDSHVVAFSNSGTFSLTATRSGGSENGTSNSFVVEPAALHHFLVEASGGGPIGEQVVYTPFFIQVLGEDTFGNMQTSFTGTVDFTSNGSLSAGGGTSGAFVGGFLASHLVNFDTGGSFTITATNSAGAESGVSNTFTVANPLPQISSIAPSHRTAGDTAFTLTVTGSGFVTSSSVVFDGIVLPTTFLSDTQISGFVAETHIDSSGVFPVEVSTPVPGGGSSNTANVTVTDPVLRAKLFLEGPYQGGTMSTQLLTDGVIPATQPFDSAPWNYAGAESVATVPAGAVDWILLELRSGTNGASMVARRAGFLLSDGTIAELDGADSVAFPGVPPGSYYVVVRSRIHIPAMSASPRPLNAPADSCDFTTGAGFYFGGSASSLGGGAVGLYSGDYSGDGFIDASDFVGPDNEIFLSGYRRSDLNMDGFIDASDYIYPDNNIFIGTDVPN